MPTRLYGLEIDVEDQQGVALLKAQVGALAFAMDAGPSRLKMTAVLHDERVGCDAPCGSLGFFSAEPF